MVWILSRPLYCVLSKDNNQLEILLSEESISTSKQKFLEHYWEFPGKNALEVSSRFIIAEDGSPQHILGFPVDTATTKGILVIITSPLASLLGMGDFINAEIEVYTLAGQKIVANNTLVSNSIAATPSHALNYMTMEIPISLDDGEPYLNVVVRYDNGMFLAQQDRLNDLSIVAIITGFLISLYIVLYVLNISIFNRIRDLSETLVKIMQGKTDIKLPEVRHDELSTLWEQLEKIAEHEEDRNRLNFELIFALKEAEDSNLAKSKFLTNMSHELRTPLNAIIGFSEIMTSNYLADDLNDRYKEYARDIRDSGLHLLNIINDILKLSKLEEGTVILENKEVIIDEIIKKSIKLVTGSAKEKSIVIKHKIADERLLLSVDESMIHQILCNILSNAVKFTPDGGKIVIISSLEKDGSYCIAISDNGIGIKEDQIGKVTSPFSQVNMGYAREHEGAGLGLALVRAFMELHSGICAWRAHGVLVRLYILNSPAVACIRKPMNSTKTEKVTCYLLISSASY